MKTLYALLILSLSSSILAQDSIPSYFSGTERWGSEITYLASSQFQSKFEVVYFLNGDTTIDNKVYHKLYLTGNVDSKSTGYSNIKPDSVWGYVRQENRTIFYLGYYPPSFRFEYETKQKLEKEDTLVSYNFEIGDTVPNTWITTQNLRENFTIESIDTIQFNAAEKRLNIGGFIEGLGFNDINIFDPLGSRIETIYFNTCFESSFYNKAFCENLYCYDVCDLSVGIDENKRENALRIYPNPVADHSIKILNYSEHGIYHLRDVAGKVLWQSSRYKGESIALDKLQPGLYFIEEYSPSGARTQSQKLIKQ